LVIKAKFVGVKDKVMFTLFRLSPRIIGRIIGKLR
jgi:hypothetical protein